MPKTAAELLLALDDNQRRVATSLHGPVAVLAGAGSGKTRALTHRIAYGVATGVYQEEKVMALTFTTRAAEELRSRLRNLGTGKVQTRTFHSAALAQLNYFWPQVVSQSTPRILDSKARLLAEVAEQLKIKVDKTILRDIAAELEWRKVSQLSIENYLKLERPLPPEVSHDSFGKFLELYEQLKDSRKQLDFEDVLLVTAGMLAAEPRVLSAVQNQYRTFLVDEFQDVSPLQNSLLELWLGRKEDVCVVGDAAQTIYSFAGATSDYLLRFSSRFQNATVIELDTNYRSSPGIIRVANRIMADQPGALQLVAAGKPGANLSPNDNPLPAGLPDLTGFDTELDEARGVAEAIRAQLKSGLSASDVAILYRMNAQSAALESALAEQNIVYQFHGGMRFFALTEVRQALMLLRGAALTLGMEPAKKAAEDILTTLGWSPEPKELTGALRERWESLNTLHSMLDSNDFPNLKSYVDYLFQREENQQVPEREAVTLATMHSAKGLEWQQVYIVGLQEGMLPIQHAKTAEQIAEERRLFYVGVTRARQGLHLSFAKIKRPVSRFVVDLLDNNTPNAAGTPALLNYHP